MIEKDDFVALADLRKPLSESRLALIAYMPRATPLSASAIRSAISVSAACRRRPGRRT
jgi:hypothetical protein